MGISTGSKIYAEYLKHPEWQRLRILILERDEFSCRKCGKMYLIQKTLQAPALVTLCKDCHARLHWLLDNGGDTSEYDSLQA